MNRNDTVLGIFALMLLADVLVIKQTIFEIAAHNSSILSAALSTELFAGLFLVCVTALLLRKRFRRQKKPISRTRLARARDLRRQHGYV